MAHEPPTSADCSDTDIAAARRAILMGAAGLAGLAALTRRAEGGPLNPPPGPVTSTPGPEPRIPISATNTPGDANSTFRITQPGSYYLTGNVTGQAGKHGVQIESSGVSIDLMGFSLVGVAGSRSGINITAALARVSVRNGRIASWGENGINGGGGEDALLESLHIHANTNVGILSLTSAVVRSCVVSRNSGGGMFLDITATVSECVAQANSGDGISTAGSSVISNCAAIANTGSGILTGSGTLISGCVARFNTTRGIWVNGNDCTLRDNTCTSNGFGTGGDGIYSAAVATLIVGNCCTTNGRGIRVVSPGNFIARNVSSGNSTANWDIAAGNKCLVVNGANSGAFAGNAGGVSPGSADPNANFTF